MSTVKPEQGVHMGATQNDRNVYVEVTANGLYMLPGLISLALQ